LGGQTVQVNVVLRNARLQDRKDLMWLAITDGRIALIGPEPGAPDALTMLDLTGAAVLPGFCDSHVHLFSSS